MGKIGLILLLSFMPLYLSLSLSLSHVRTTGLGLKGLTHLTKYVALWLIYIVLYTCFDMTHTQYLFFFSFLEVHV